MSVEVNMQLTWEEAGETITDPVAGTKIKDAFKGGKATKVLLPATMPLYKFNQYPSLVAGDENAALAADPKSSEAAAYFSQTLSPWWSPYQPYEHDGGWQQRKSVAISLGVSIRELGRVTSAIKENWNSLEYLLVITLKHDVHAFFGGFAQMSRQDPGSQSRRIVAGDGVMAEGTAPTANLPGGATQFYIPNLRPTNIANWRVESLASC